MFVSLIDERWLLTRGDACCSDMKDRIGMRDHVQEAVAWKDPETLSLRSGSWRSSSEPRKGPQIQSPDSDSNSICRSLRGLIAWKPVAQNRALV